MPSWHPAGWGWGRLVGGAFPGQFQGLYRHPHGPSRPLVLGSTEELRSWLGAEFAAAISVQPLGKLQQS